MSIIGADVTMSSIRECTDSYCFDGSKVVDGIYAPIGMHELTSIAHTGYEYHPWIQIKLYQNFCVSAVKIWNRYMSGEGGYDRIKLVKINY